jgi:hypothetical protein
MPRTKPRRGRARFALVIRLLGATALFVALLGLIPLATAIDVTSARAWEAALREYGAALPVIRFTHPYRDVGLSMLLGGATVFVFTLLVQALAGLQTVAGRRNAVATNAVIQTALAVVLLVGVNVYSFQHHRRYDWTRDRQFTLPASVTDELRQLRGQTEIVVYQRHKTFGQLSEKPDAYDYAAERKVVEKVQDLVDQFRAFGPQFRVQVLDVEEQGYDQKLDRLTKDAPALRAAIDAAPDNSIFFYARRDGGGASVQRLSFNDFYQLDKTASQSADGGRGNLVLLPQGVEPFAHKVLTIEERKPRVGVAVIHEWLTTEGLDEFSMAGVRKALTANGFEVTDIVLKKKWGEAAEPEPSAHTYEESKYERLEEEVAEIDASLQAIQLLRRQRQAGLDQFKTTSLADLTRIYRNQLGGRQFTEELRKIQIDALTGELETLDFAQKQNTEARNQLEAERQTLSAQERLVEERRMTDLKAKLAKLLSECDLLIVPRMTLRNLVVGDRIPPRLYRLDEAQVGAIKEFLQAGKPVLACFGPVNEPADRRTPGPSGPDALENLLAQLGIQFGQQTVLFGTDSRALAERRSSPLASGAGAEPPPVTFEPKSPRASAAYNPANALAGEEPKLPALNPIALSMKITGQNLGGRQKLDLRLRHPRPVYFVPSRPGESAAEAGFLFSDPDSWNEDQPFPTRERTPRFEPPKPDDPTRSTRDEKRRGPFPLAVAVQTTIPIEWTDPAAVAAKAAALTGAGADEAANPQAVTAQGLVPAAAYAGTGYKPTTVRVAAIGHGGLFVGPELSPPKERLLLNTCNWLLGRDERLPHPAGEWQYPRVHLSERAASLWFLGTLVALPALFVFLGRLVLLTRRYR